MRGWLLTLFAFHTTVLLAGCDRGFNHLRHQVEAFLRAHPELIYIAAGVVLIAVVAKAFRIAMVLAVVALLVLVFYFLARMGEPT
jgi:hypothetical protein